MTMFLRVDDFPWVKEDERDKHNLDNFKDFDDILTKYDVEQYTLGVIPNHLSDEDIQFLHDSPHIRVAMHGIDHDNRFPSEFKNYETSSDIYRKIVNAREEKLSELDVDCYIPPFNNINLATAQALHEAGFKEIMCGPGTDVREFMAIRNSGLFSDDRLTYSRHPDFYGRTDEMMNRDGSIEKILSSKHDEVVTLHWTWEMNIGLHNLEKFMSQLKGVWGKR